MRCGDHGQNSFRSAILQGSLGRLGFAKVGGNNKGKAIMDFEFSDEQELLREQARGFLADNCPPTVVRKVLDGDAEYDAELWQKVAEMGWTATVIPEEFGGLGLSYLELVVIAEELGRAAAPIPFSSSVYLATEALLAVGSQEQKEKWLPLLASGEAIGTFALAEGNGRPSVSNLTICSSISSWAVVILRLPFSGESTYNYD